MVARPSRLALYLCAVLISLILFCGTIYLAVELGQSHLYNTEGVVWSTRNCSVVNCVETDYGPDCTYHGLITLKYDWEDVTYKTKVHPKDIVW